MKRSHKILIAAGSIFVAILIFSATILPVIIRHKATGIIEEECGRKTRIEAVSFNPLTLTTVIHGFNLAGKNGEPFVSFKQLTTSFSPASLFKGALIISQVAIDEPSIAVQRLSANQYSFNDIIERQKAKPKKPASKPMLFSINNISIKNGSIDFGDRVVTGGKNHTIRNLNVAVPFISNIPYLVDKYTDPSISASVNGAPFSFSGKIKPLSKSMETSVHVDLRQLNIPEYMGYSPVKAPISITSGKLTIDTEITYRVSKDKQPELGLSGVIALDDIAVNRTGGAPLIRLHSLQIKPADLEVFSKHFTFASIKTNGLELFVNRDRHGDWMYKSLLPQSASEPQPTADKTAATPPAGAKSVPPLVRIASFVFEDGVVHFRDELPKGGFAANLSAIDLTMNNIDNQAATPADFDFSLLLDNEAELSSQGTVIISAAAATANTALTGLNLKKGWPYLSAFLTAPVSGMANLSAAVEFNKESGLTAKDGALQINRLGVKYGDKEGVELGQLSVSGASFNQKQNRAEIAEIRLSKGDISLSRAADGTISPLALLVKPAAPAGSSSVNAPVVKTATASAAKPQQPFSYSVSKIQLERFNVAFTDKFLEDAPRFTLKDANISMRNINGPRFTPVKLAFNTLFNRDTTLKVAGEIMPQPFRFKGDVALNKLQLRDFESYIPDSVNVELVGGTFDTTMNVDIALKDGKPIGSFKGNAGVRAFHCLDSVAEEDLLKWESLQLDEIQGGLAPFSLAIRQVALNNVYSRIVVRKDGSLNLQNLVDKSEQTPVVEPPRLTPAATATLAQPVARPQVSIGAVTIQDGTLSFTDRHLPQNFNSTFHNLGGRVTGLSSEESILADVDLRGNLENHSPLQITGKINPLKQDLFVDLKVSFKDIELSPVTPYSGTYLGYTVDKGKLFLDLKYLIDKKQLNSENRVFIDQFTFGKLVESEKATKLPVRLAIALLKDRQGEIHLDLPVTGRTDDPKFSIWGVVWQVLKNLLVKAATSPFALLSSMSGGGHDFSSVHFDAGRSRLAAAEEDKLKALAKALGDRPGLKMEIKGYVDRDKDAEGYRRELLERKIRNEKFLAMAKERRTNAGQTAETTQVTPEEQGTYLQLVYKKEKFPKPRNALGLVKDLPDEEMRKLIIANTMVGENEFQELARERSLAVMNFMVAKGGLQAERLFQKNEDIFKAPESSASARSRVEFNAIAQ